MGLNAHLIMSELNINKNKIPIFGDAHGNIELIFRTLQKLQEQNQEIYKYVFQVGDLGYFKDVLKMDSVTQDLVNKHPSELGVANYLTNPEMYERFFVQPKDYKRLKAKIIFIRGNHEDQSLIQKMTQNSKAGLVKADDYGVLNFLPDGRAVNICYGYGDSITVAAYGGIDPKTRPKAYDNNPLIGMDNKALEKLISLNNVNILLTHQGPSSIRKGSSEIDDIIEVLEPDMHFHGHTHSSRGPEIIGKTKSYSLGKLPKDQNSNHSYFALITLK